MSASTDRKKRQEAIANGWVQAAPTPAPGYSTNGQYYGYPSGGFYPNVFQ